MVRQVAVFSKRRYEIHRGAGVAHGKADHRIGLGDMTQVGLRNKEAAVALSRQLYSRWDIAGFQLHIWDEIGLAAQLVR